MLLTLQVMPSFLPINSRCYECIAKIYGPYDSGGQLEGNNVGQNKLIFCPKGQLGGS